MDNQSFVTALLPLVGGPGNIKGAIYCHTRLRLTLADYSIVDDAAVKKLDGVLTTKQSADQYQVVVGEKVKEAYNELLKHVTISPVQDSGRSSGPKRRKNIFIIFAEMMSGVFTHVITAICGSGLMTGIQVLLTNTGVIQPGDTLHTILGVLGDTAFYFLPFIIAVSAADRFKCNKIMAIALVGVLMHPTWATLLSGGVESIYLLEFIPIKLMTYSSSILPALFAVYALSKLEALLTRIIPPAVHAVTIPFLELLILGPVALTVVGPLGQWVGGLLVSGYAWLFSVAAVPASALFGGVYPLIVMTGTHLTFATIMIDSIVKNGVDYIMPLMSIAHCGLVGASLAVLFKTKNAKMRSVAATGVLVTGIGLTEPALYGVCLPLKKPLVISLISSCLGGAFFGVFKVTALGLGLSPLGSIPLYLTDTFIYWVIGSIATVALAFVGTWFFGYKPHMEEELGIQ